jgi:hypothetical protein
MVYLPTEFNTHIKAASTREVHRLLEAMPLNVKRNDDKGFRLCIELAWQRCCLHAICDGATKY